jgi:hypothetical protein
LGGIYVEVFKEASLLLRIKMNTIVQSGREEFSIQMDLPWQSRR